MAAARAGEHDLAEAAAAAKLREDALVEKARAAEGQAAAAEARARDAEKATEEQRAAICVFEASAASLRVELERERAAMREIQRTCDATASDKLSLMRRHEHLEAQLAAAVDRERDANEQRSIAEQHRIAAEQQIGKFERARRLSIGSPTTRRRGRAPERRS